MPARKDGSRQSRHTEWADEGRELAEQIGIPRKEGWPRTHSEILPIVESRFHSLFTDLETPMAVTNRVFAWLQSPDRKR